MDFHQLKVFVEVARQKSFSRAAETIFLTQPTVSAHIKALEREIGTPLLDRGRRELRLTAAGEVLLRYAEQLLEIKREAFSAIQGEGRIIKGHLEIASSSVPGAYILPGLMKSFLKKYVDVTFAVLLRDTQQVYESVRDYSYDLGFVGEPVHHDSLEQIKLLPDELVLIAAPGIHLPGEKRIRLEGDGPGAGSRGGGVGSSRGKESCPFPDLFSEYDLGAGENWNRFLELPFLMREPGSATRVVFESALQVYGGKGRDGIPLNVVACLESQEAIKEAVKAGLGVTVISRHAVGEELAAGSLKGYRLPDLRLERDFYLIYRRNLILSPLSRAFLDHCTGSVGPTDGDGEA